MPIPTEAAALAADMDSVATCTAVAAPIATHIVLLSLNMGVDMVHKALL